jgi:hypothetical protein
MLTLKYGIGVVLLLLLGFLLIYIVPQKYIHYLGPIIGLFFISLDCILALYINVAFMDLALPEIGLRFFNTSQLTYKLWLTLPFNIQFTRFGFFAALLSI